MRQQHCAELVHLLKYSLVVLLRLAQLSLRFGPLAVTLLQEFLHDVSVLHVSEGGVLRLWIWPITFFAAPTAPIALKANAIFATTPITPVGAAPL
eukprot:3468432-Pleurochrysis_carterae.AAC.1